MPESKKLRDVGASVRARLLNLARQKGQALDLLLTRYAIERLLHRLSISPHRDRFVLSSRLRMLGCKTIAHLVSGHGTGRVGP